MPWWQVVGGIFTIPALVLAVVYTTLQIKKIMLEIRKLRGELQEASSAKKKGKLTEASERRWLWRKSDLLVLGLLYFVATVGVAAWIIADPPLNSRSLLVLLLTVLLYPTALILGVGLGVLRLVVMVWNRQSLLLMSLNEDILRLTARAVTAKEEGLSDNMVSGEEVATRKRAH